MPSLILEDFRGGRNTLEAVNQIRNPETPDQDNVWVENRALAKRRGSTTTAITASGLSLIPEQLKSTHLAASSLLRLAMIGRVSAHSQRYLMYTDNGTAFVLAAYNAGTCETSGLSNSVTGTDTAWLTNVSAGDYFLPAGGGLNEITLVANETGISVTTAVNISAGTSYQIFQAIAQGSPAGMALFDVSGSQNLFVADGTNFYRWDGTIQLKLASPPSSIPRILLVHKNYMFGLRHDNTTLIWSAIRDATSWPSANSQTITHVGDPIRGGFVYGDSIIIWTRSRMFRVIGDTFDPSNPTYVIEEISVPNDFNFVFSRTPVVHQGVLKFLATDGWYGYAGGIQIEKISNRIQADVDGFRRLAFAAEAMQDSAVAFVYKDRLWCSVPDNAETPADTLNVLYVQDEDGAWWKWDTSATSTAGEYSDFALVKFGLTGTYQLMAGNVGTNKISVVDTGNNDDGGAIDGNWTSKEFVFPNDVEFTRAAVVMKKQDAGNLTFSFSIDRRAFVDFTCDMTAGAGEVIRKTIPIARVGKAIRLKVANSTASQTFEVYRIEVDFHQSQAERV